ncbi:hypothetical protein C8Q75DRAFT_324608 [Abortiporus biennis]|nr:hypothetical protein C8Q75DRAFT_324608 [Abortiporus biennis]
MDFNVPKPTFRAPRPLPSIPSSSSSRSSNELWRSVEDSASSRSFNLRTGHSNINRDSMVFGLGFGSGDIVQVSKPMPILRPSSMYIDEPSDSDSEDILSLGESECGSSDEHFAHPSSILPNSSIMEDDLHSNVDRKARRRQGVDFHSRADFVEMVKLLNEEVDRGDQEIEENAAITMSEVLEQEIRAVGLDSNPMTMVSSASSVIYNDGGDEEDPDDFSWEAEEESGEVIELGVARSMEVRGNKLEKIGDVHYEDVNVLPAAMGVGNSRTNPPLGGSPLIKPHSLSPPRPEISIPSVSSITISQPSPLDALAMYDALGGRPDSFSSYELLSSNTESSSHQHVDLEENEPEFEPRSAFDSDTESEDESPKHKHSIKISNGWGSKTSNSKVNTFSQLKKALRGSISMPSVKVRSSTQLSPRPIPSSHTSGATAAASQDKDQIHKQSFSTPPSAVSTHSHSISISSPTTRLTNTTATNRYSPTSSPLTSPSKLRSLVHEEQLLRIDSRTYSISSISVII